MRLLSSLLLSSAANCSTVSEGLGLSLLVLLLMERFWNKGQHTNSRNSRRFDGLVGPALVRNRYRDGIAIGLPARNLEVSAISATSWFLMV